jgi:predicted RNA-binding protein with RPS1 domain
MVTEDIWSTIEPGQVLTGSVKAIKEFGALISLDSETVGLVHSSEMAKFTQEFKEGKDLDVKVLHVDRSSRKIFLISPN